MLWGIPMASVGGVLLTHFHSDHIGDLGELNLQTWVGGRPAPLGVYGGPGVDRVVAGFNRGVPPRPGLPDRAPHASGDAASATWPMVRAPDRARRPADAGQGPHGAVVLDDGGLRITAIEVDHAPIAPAYAYRFDYKGRSAFITGDLKFHPPLVSAAQGVDLLVSEAIAV